MWTGWTNHSDTMNCILILQEGHQIAFVLHSASLWYFAFRTSVPGKYQSVGFLFHAQINLITSKINDICSMKREKNSLFYLSILPQSLLCLSFQIFSSWYRGMKVEGESWDNPLITSEVLKISLGRERERWDVGGWVLVLFCICLLRSITNKHRQKVLIPFVMLLSALAGYRLCPSDTGFS